MGMIGRHAQYTDALLPVFNNLRPTRLEPTSVAQQAPRIAEAVPVIHAQLSPLVSPKATFCHCHGLFVAP
jgi:hypothetical protein